MSNELYGLIDPAANKFVVVSTNFSAIKQVQFVIMQKYFYPVLNITQTIDYQKKYNTEYRDIILDNIDNTNCVKYGANTTMIQSLEQTVSLNNAKESGIMISPTDIDISYKLKDVLEIILEIFEIIQIQLDSIKNFKIDSTRDKDNGIKEFFNFLKLLVDTPDHSEELKKIFEQELNLNDRHSADLHEYQKYVTKSLIDSFNKIDISNNDFVLDFINDMIDKTSKTKNTTSPRYRYFLLEDGFDNLSSFQKNPNLYKDLIKEHSMIEHIRFFLSKKLNEITDR